MGQVMATVVDFLRKSGRFFSGVVGADKYHRYVEHFQRVHPGEEPLSEKEWWRQYHDFQDKNPGARCC
ncbi:MULTISPECIES: YbdD/YjiX family protein [unclassified Arthrobacter]|uniref:YbdD/YjiX family protein n=1 Tax=unclassified Arthrobacter TaxID=235627 RepID=UPI0008AD7665|nr:MULTISPECIES: YbdD/YjiX family protein [unclassified Arthrobacter]OFT24429.1 hypothetical protein HMPREF3175_00760 [Arthrobacter sp. HMSC08H08]OFT44020.1 hypothetical protein HMPREF3160_01250 [Arthrobacter sp. HMSC06H05]